MLGIKENLICHSKPLVTMEMACLPIQHFQCVSPHTIFPPSPPLPPLPTCCLYLCDACACERERERESASTNGMLVA